MNSSSNPSLQLNPCFIGLKSNNKQSLNSPKTKKYEKKLYNYLILLFIAFLFRMLVLNFFLQIFLNLYYQKKKKNHHQLKKNL